jgi:hypothetical protein
MREIVKVLLQEGIDESMINRVLDLIEEEYEVTEGLDFGDKIYNIAKKKGLSNSDAIRLRNKADKVPNDHDCYVNQDGEIAGHVSLKGMSKVHKGELNNYYEQDHKKREQIENAYEKGKISLGKNRLLRSKQDDKFDSQLEKSGIVR